MARFFRQAVMRDSYRWNPLLMEFDNGRDARGEVINAGTYILSRDGMAAVVDDKAFIPLNAGTIREERAKLR